MLRAPFFVAAIVFATNVVASNPKITRVEPSIARIANAETVHVAFDELPAASTAHISPSGPYVVQTLQDHDALSTLTTKNGAIWRQIDKQTIELISFDDEGLKKQFSFSEPAGIKTWSADEATLAIVTSSSDLKLLSYDRNKTTLLHTRTFPQSPDKISVSTHHACFSNSDNSLYFWQAETNEITPLAAASDIGHIIDVNAFGKGCAIVTDRQQIFVYLQENGQFVPATYALQTPALRLYSVRGLLHVANGDIGYSLFDITTPGVITWLSAYHKAGHIVDLAVDGNTVGLIALDGTVSLIDITQTDNPALVSDYFIGARGKAIGLARDNVIVDDGQAISLINFAARSAPFVTSLGASWGGSRRSFITGNYLYVADWFSGLHIYDIHTDKPKHVATFHTTGSAKGVLVRDNVAYVGDDDQGLEIIDVRDPSNPTLMAHLALPGLAYTMDLHGNRLYLAGHSGGFHIIDIAQPKNPLVLGHYDTPGKSWAIRVHDHFAYVADDKSGILVFDVADPANIRLVSEFNPGGQAEDVVIDYPYAYAAFFDAGFFILDIRNPTNPQQISHLKLTGNTRGIAIQDRKAYVASWQAGVHVIDISNTKKPQWTSTYDTTGYAWGLSVHNKTAYVMDWWGGIKVLDINDSSRIKQTNLYHGDEPLREIAARRQYLFAAADKQGIQIFDGKNPLNPIWAGALELSGRVSTIAIKDDFAFVARDKFIDVVNISDAFHPMVVATRQTDANIRSLKIFSNHLCALDENGSVSLFAIDSAYSLNRVNTYPINAQKIAANDNACFAASHDRAHKIYSAKTQWKTSEITVKITKSIAANETSVFVADEANTLHIFDANDLNKEKQVITLAAPVTQLLADNNQLFVLSAGRSVTAYNEFGGQYKASESYSTRHQISDGVKRENAIFFTGEPSLISLELLPTFRIESKSGEISINVPANTPQGSYDLTLHMPNGESLLYRDVFKVGFPKPKKSKFTLDDLKKKLQEKNFEGRAPGN